MWLHHSTSSCIENLTPRRCLWPGQIWDTRTNKPVFTFTDNEVRWLCFPTRPVLGTPLCWHGIVTRVVGYQDVITDFAINDKRDTALATRCVGVAVAVAVAVWLCL